MTEQWGQQDEMVDAAVIGGGAAGLNGALMLARSRREVLVIDSGSPRNAPADGVHGLLGREGMPPAELLRIGREEVQRYGGRILDSEVTDAVRSDDGFVVTLGDGRTVGARRLLVATGLRDVLPDIPGLAERWGRDLVHCPYCHGWEVRDRAIGIVATGEGSVHQALLFRQLSDDVVYLANGHGPDETARARFDALGVPIVEGRIAAVETTDDRITGVRLGDGRLVAREVLAVGSRMQARTHGLQSLGLRVVELPGGMGTSIEADEFGRTGVPGVWAAGNVADAKAQVGAAAAAGALAGAQINAELALEDADRAVALRRSAAAGRPAGR
jgi:thioredoxin reductase